MMGGDDSCWVGYCLVMVALKVTVARRQCIESEEWYGADRSGWGLIFNGIPFEARDATA